ncbi:unnamed protein product, partial [Lymnaea stagnalis]
HVNHPPPFLPVFSTTHCIAQYMALRTGICTALNQETLDKLKVAGIKKVTDFLAKDPELLSHDIHIAYKDVCSIRRVLLAEHSAYPVSAARLYQNALSSLTILPTGCQNLDDLLDGGLYTGEVTELAGESASGKTRLCLWSAASTILTENQSVVYIDTCASFSPECVLESLPLDKDSNSDVSEDKIHEMLQKIRCVELFEIFELFAVIDNIMSDLNKPSPDEYRNLKLVIVDNLVSVVYPIMGGNIRLCQGLISQLGMKLKELAVSHSLAILLTNNLTSSFNGSKRKPALGKAWSHVPHTRLLLQRPMGVSCHQNSQREACLVKSSRQVTLNL